ncbi:unnamed protein product, partial [Sphagnum jensenii]
KTAPTNSHTRAEEEEGRVVGGGLGVLEQRHVANSFFLVTHDQQFGNYRSVIIQLDVNLAKL